MCVQTAEEARQRAQIEVSVCRLPSGIEPVEGSGAAPGTCCACGGEEDTSDDQLLQCDACRQFVHMGCYDVEQPPEGRLWLCDLCQLGVFQRLSLCVCLFCVCTRYVCFLCLLPPVISVSISLCVTPQLCMSVWMLCYALLSHALRPACESLVVRLNCGQSAVHVCYVSQVLIGIQISPTLFVFPTKLTLSLSYLAARSFKTPARHSRLDQCI